MPVKVLRKLDGGGCSFCR